ncbi:hypothetical protein [Tabrizicola sp.]|uniref:hypothetical protein n=1 Tax=Tabrizicola sp. TaxID=2005166 RepID=UPI003F403C00
MNGSILSYSLKFAANTVVVFAVIVGALYLIDRFAPGLLQGGLVAGAVVGALIGLVLVPVVSVAKAFYLAEKRHVGGMEGIVMSIIFAVLTLVIVAAGAAVANRLMTGNPLGVANLTDLTADPGALAALGGGAFVALVVVYRLFLWAGIRGEMVRAAKG